MMCKSALQHIEALHKNGGKANLNGKASGENPHAACLLKLFVSSSFFLGCFIDKWQAGGVKGIKGPHRAESWLDKYRLPSGNPGSDASAAPGD